MKRTTKVTLLSMLVFPGAGHLLLKKHLIALAFISSFAYLLLSFITEVVDKSQQVVDSIIKGEIPLELSAIALSLEEHGVIGSQQQTFVSYLLLLIWALAAFDAYRIAKNSTSKGSLTDNDKIG